LVADRVERLPRAGGVAARNKMFGRVERARSLIHGGARPINYHRRIHGRTGFRRDRRIKYGRTAARTFSNRLSDAGVRGKNRKETSPLARRPPLLTANYRRVSRFLDDYYYYITRLGTTFPYTLYNSFDRTFRKFIIAVLFFLFVPPLLIRRVPLIILRSNRFSSFSFRTIIIAAAAVITRVSRAYFRAESTERYIAACTEKPTP